VRERERRARVRVTHVSQAALAAYAGILPQAVLQVADSICNECATIAPARGYIRIYRAGGYIRIYRAQGCIRISPLFRV
jgi:hypothetical protein